MTIDSAHDWKLFYAAERERFGAAWLDTLLAQAEERIDAAAATPAAMVVPHTRLEVTANQIAAAATRIVAAGHERVLALGVVHGGRRCDASIVAAARAGSAEARAELRGVHTVDGLAAEEFSLDTFAEVLARSAQRAGRAVELVARYPFLVGDDPASLPGLDELITMVADGAALVATADPVHHGHAYGTPAAECCDPSDPATVTAARSAVARQLRLLEAHDFTGFATQVAADRSDFRDTGPVLATLLGTGWHGSITELELVDYSTALAARAPTWVAGALVDIS